MHSFRLAMSDNRWDKKRVVVGPGESERVRGPRYPRTALISDWVRINGEETRAKQLGANSYLFRANGTRVVAQYRPRATRTRYLISNFGDHKARVKIGSRITGSTRKAHRTR